MEMAHAVPDGFNLSFTKMANAAFELRARLLRTPEGRALIEKELENMRREAQEKGVPT